MNSFSSPGLSWPLNAAFSKIDMTKYTEAQARAVKRYTEKVKHLRVQIRFRQDQLDWLNKQRIDSEAFAATVKRLLSQSGMPE